MTNSERIEAYFNNDLSETENQQLLQDVDSDPSLKTEFKFQQEVVDGIKTYRKQELIANLDKIQVASVGQSVLIKTLTAVGIATVVGIGGYMWYSNTSPEPSLPQNQEVVITTQPESVEEEPESTQDILASAAQEDGQKSQSEREKAILRKKPVEKAKDSEKEGPVIPIPDVTEPDNGQSEDSTNEISAPEAMASADVALSTRTDVEVKLSKKYKFHYQIKGGGLTLYGDFKEEPFEVLEIKTNEGIKTYLFYKDKFYSLKQDNEDINPLVLVADARLIKELQKRR